MTELNQLTRQVLEKTEILAKTGKCFASETTLSAQRTPNTILGHSKCGSIENVTSRLAIGCVIDDFMG